MNNSNHIPNRLQAGDCIGIIAPAGQITETNRLEQGIIILREMGFEVKLPRSLWPGTGYLADTDRNRALEFHKMWADDEVDGLLALRGGFGCLRLLPFLDLEELKKHQKILVGFSDLSILHTLLYQNNDLITFHGPMLTTLASSDKDSLERFYASITGKWDKSINCNSIEIVRGGDPVSGRLLGGNLSSLVSILSTPVHPDFSEAILFLEDVGEPLYRLDKMLTQLALCNILQNASGIILGDFSPSKEMDSLESIRFHEEIWTRVLELTAHTNIPVWGNFPIGHGSDNLTLPHGSFATMHNHQAILSFS